MNPPAGQPLPEPLDPHAATPDAAASEGAQTHRVSAIYPTREEAEAVRQQLIARGIAQDDVVLLHASDPPLAEQPALEEKSDEALKDMLVDGIIGTAVGTGVGAIGTVMMVAANVTLFVASPVIAPLAMLGWFAGVGGLVGAAAGADNRTEGKLSDLVKDAIAAGNTVLMVRARDEATRQSAKQVINESLAGSNGSAHELGAG